MSSTQAEDFGRDASTIRRMKRSLWRRACQVACTMGLDPRVTFRSSRSVGWFIRDLRAFKRASSVTGAFPFGHLYPCLGDKTAESGDVSGHYFHQDLLVARRIFARSPARHIDVGSRLDGFVAHVASFRQIEVLDIRPLRKRIPNVVFRQADLTQLGPGDGEIADSVSCLHALEHFGLGRYGDAIDPEGHLKGLAGLHAMLRPGGLLYLSVPIGPQRIEFNAHRVFSLPYLMKILEPRFAVEALSYVDDAGDLFENVDVDAEGMSTNYGCYYGCGIFELRRR